MLVNLRMKFGDAEALRSNAVLEDLAAACPELAGFVPLFQDGSMTMLHTVGHVDALRYEQWISVQTPDSGDPTMSSKHDSLTIPIEVICNRLRAHGMDEGTIQSMRRKMDDPEVREFILAQLDQAKEIAQHVKTAVQVGGAVSGVLGDFLNVVRPNRPRRR